MSRIGNKPVLIPEKIEMNLSENSIIVKGPKGELILLCGGSDWDINADCLGGWRCYWTVRKRSQQSNWQLCNRLVGYEPNIQTLT